MIIIYLSVFQCISASFSLERGARRRSKKKPPSDNCQTAIAVLFSLSVLAKARSTKKETLSPTHGLARNFASKLPSE